MASPCQIQVSGGLSATFQNGIFPLISQLMLVEFNFDDKPNAKAAQGVLRTRDESQITKGSPQSSLSCCLPSNSPASIATEVVFTDQPEVPFPFRGRRISTRINPHESLVPQAQETVLATTCFGPIWLVSEIEGMKHYRSALPLPTLETQQNFHDVFNGECFLETLVLLEFIRKLPDFPAYLNAPLRAGFIIDDPNLHWTHYGYINFREVVAHAKQWRYHIAFATIPLDAWFTHSATATLFKANPNWISLLVHGNDHGKEELAQNYSPEIRTALLQTAARRINTLEQQAGFQVSRVMVPPHGACSADMLSELPECGFEAACISANSIRAYNTDKAWVKTLGFYPAETINDCPVLPRWGLTGKVKTNLLIAAYLGQPMILRGHHQDFKNGIAVFDDYARFINSLGDVSWSNLTTLTRNSYQSRLIGTTCLIKPFSRKMMVKIPETVTEILIEALNPISTTPSPKYQVQIGGLQFEAVAGEKINLPKTTRNNQTMTIERLPRLTTTNNGMKKTTVKLILRRLLTETRDRLFMY